MTHTKLELGSCLELKGPPIEVAKAAKSIRVIVERTITNGSFKGYQLDLLPPAVTQYAYRSAARQALASHPGVTIEFLDQNVFHIV